MRELLRKLSSRKFWMAVAGVVTGIAMAFGVESSAVATIAGAVTAVASVVTYVVTEGRVDVNSAQKAAETVCDAVKLMATTEGTSDDATDGS